MVDNELFHAISEAFDELIEGFYGELLRRFLTNPTGDIDPHWELRLREQQADLNAIVVRWIAERVEDERAAEHTMDEDKLDERMEALEDLGLEFQPRPRRGV